MSIKYRKNRIKRLASSWNGELENDLFMSWKIPVDLFAKLQFAVGLYISKAMHFSFISNEKTLTT